MFSHMFGSVVVGLKTDAATLPESIAVSIRV